MTAVEHRDYTLYCNHPGCRMYLEGSRTEARAQVRKVAAKRGWTHIRRGLGPKYDDDYCPEHKPTEGEKP